MSECVCVCVVTAANWEENVPLCVLSRSPLTRVFKGTQHMGGMDRRLGSGFTFPRGEPLQSEAHTRRGGASPSQHLGVCPPGMVPGPTAAATPGSLVEMWHLGAQTQPTE